MCMRSSISRSWQDRPPAHLSPRFLSLGHSHPLRLCMADIRVTKLDSLCQSRPALMIGMWSNDLVHIYTRAMHQRKSIKRYPAAIHLYEHRYVFIFYMRSKCLKKQRENKMWQLLKKPRKFERNFFRRTFEINASRFFFFKYPKSLDWNFDSFRIVAAYIRKTVENRVDIGGQILIKLQFVIMMTFLSFQYLIFLTIYGTWSFCNFDQIPADEFCTKKKNLNAEMTKIISVYFQNDF